MRSRVNESLDGRIGDISTSLDRVGFGFQGRSLPLSGRPWIDFALVIFGSVVAVALAKADLQCMGPL